jgi:hypothetical protein
MNSAYAESTHDQQGKRYVHRLLGTVAGSPISSGRENLCIRCDVVDEASMVDLP